MDAKIRISPHELKLMSDAGFFTHKQQITESISQIMALLRDKLSPMLSTHSHVFPEGCDITLGKLSKGENYKGLPYLILDFPKKIISNQNGIASDIFLLRTMFWWGNYFSFHFHLEGNSFLKYASVLENKLTAMKGKEYYICIKATQWDYDFSNTNYMPIDEYLNKSSQFGDLAFLKIAKKIPIENWESVPVEGTIFMNEILLLLD